MQEVIHRDLKPENILVDGDNVAIADFGIARFSEDTIATAMETGPNQRLANFMYAAPEQRIPNRGVDHLADIYALGLILNEMLTGAVPHGTEYTTVESKHPEFAFVDPVVAKMLAQRSFVIVVEMHLAAE